MPRWLTYTLAALAVLVVILVLTAPIGPMPGIRLGGSPATVPESWSSVALPDEVKLATKSGLFPHVVIIWVVALDDRLYLVGAPDSTWVENATRSPQVQLRMGDDVYNLTATRVDGRVEVLQSYIDRYREDYPDIIASFPPMEEFAAGAALFELSAR